MATARTSVGRVEQRYIELVGRLGTARATCDFKHVAMYWAAFAEAGLMHHTVVATAKTFSAISEVGAVGGLQHIG